MRAAVLNRSSSSSKEEKVQAESESPAGSVKCAGREGAVSILRPPHPSSTTTITATTRAVLTWPPRSPPARWPNGHSATCLCIHMFYSSSIYGALVLLPLFFLLSTGGWVVRRAKHASQLTGCMHTKEKCRKFRVRRERMCSVS